MRSSAAALLSPPVRLRALPERWAGILRLLWTAFFLFACVFVVMGTVQAYRTTYQVSPAFFALGLDYDIEDSGEIKVRFEPERAPPGLAEKSLRIAGVDGSRVPADIRSSHLAKRLNAGSGGATLDLVDNEGRRFRVHRQRIIKHRVGTESRLRDARVTARLVSGLLACGALLLCSFLLTRRRANDPVALLFAFAFTGMASTIDPPLAMWMELGWPPAYDIISSAWFYLLLIALALFPDGIFVPRSYRWLIVAGVPLAVLVSLPSVNAFVSAFLAIGALLAMLVGQVQRYRRLEPGIERQQIKWAAFGFASGLLLLLASFVLLLALPEHPTARDVVLVTAITLFFSLGMAAIPLGLLIALTRFRLWEADAVITRSAAYAVVTVVVGVVWAASADLVKLVIEEVVGRQSEAGATTIGAVIAAGVFSPTQSLVLGWTKRRFSGPVDRVRGAAKRLKSWGLTETPAEVATRALAIVDEAVHPSASAILLDEAMGQELVAARNTEGADDPRLVERLVLADDESAVGMLLLGRRSDGNRYNVHELEAVRELIPPLADALRVARSRHSRESTMQQRLDEMAARLAQLEGGTPKPA